MRIECQKNVGMRHTKRTKRLVTKSKAFPAAKVSEASQALRLLSLCKDLALPLGGMVEQDGALLHCRGIIFIITIVINSHSYNPLSGVIMHNTNCNGMFVMTL